MTHPKSALAAAVFAVTVSIAGVGASDPAAAASTNTPISKADPSGQSGKIETDPAAGAPAATAPAPAGSDSKAPKTASEPAKSDPVLSSPAAAATPSTSGNAADKATSGAASATNAAANPSPGVTGRASGKPRKMARAHKSSKKVYASRKSRVKYAYKAGYVRSDRKQFHAKSRPLGVRLAFHRPHHRWFRLAFRLRCLNRRA